METQWFDDKASILVHLECIDILLIGMENAIFEQKETKEGLIELLKDLKTIFLAIKNEDSTK